MLETIRKFIKGVWNKIMNKSTIESKMNIDIAMSNEMSTFIKDCKDIYEDKAKWVDNKTVFSMNLGAGIASEIARLVTLEFKSEISNNNFLNKEYQAVIDNIRTYTEYAAATGGLVFKPYISNNRIEVDVVQADMFFPTAYTSRGEVTGCVLPETKVIGEYTYTRLEYHNFTNEGHMIRNVAFKKKNLDQFRTTQSDSLGDEIPLSEIEDWANLEPQVTIRNVDRPLFSYFKMPLANTIDSSSPLGVSVYARVAKDILKKADEQYSRIDWEFRGSELSIDVSADMMRDYDNGTLTLPTGKERLYRRLDIDPTADKTSGWNIFSPNIRDISLYNGLQHQLRTIEFLCGLAYGTISDPNETDKTAEEIKSSKQRSYQLVKDIQKSLRTSLENLVYIMSVWGQLANLGVKPVNIETDISFDFDDSIVKDIDKENDSMFLDVSSGIIDRLYYVMKKYKVTKEKALEMIANTQDSINDNSLDKNINPSTGLPS
jgi:A118 family predicted phage portal protein